MLQTHIKLRDAGHRVELARPLDLDTFPRPPHSLAPVNNFYQETLSCP